MKNRKDSYKLIFGYLGFFSIFIGIMCLLPLVLLFFYPTEKSNFWWFLVPAVISIGTGIALTTTLLKKQKVIKLGKHQDCVLLVLIWIYSILICSLPFIFSGTMNFTQSIFETTSGFSTIGLTVFKNFIGTENQSHLLIFWRSILTLIGGVGLILVITTALSDKFKLNLYTAEGHNDKLLPNLRKSAIAIFGIYLGFIFIGTILYSIVFLASNANTGEEIFEAIVHSISAVATGGFSSRSGGLVEIESIYGGAWAIEIISIILMLAGSINFLTHLFIITGKFKKVWKDCEIRFLVFSALVMIPLFFITVLTSKNFNGWDSFRHGAFTFFSSITTTGFSTINNISLLGNSTLLLIVLMNVIGGGAGSTAGGIKQYRFVVAVKSFYWNAKARIESSRMIYPHFVSRSGEDKEITPNDSLEAFGYILLYLSILFIGGLLVTLFNNGISFDMGIFEFSNAISSTGLSNGITSQAGNCIHFGDFATLWVLIIGMFAGRLEILPIYYAFFRGIRDIFGKETI